MKLLGLTLFFIFSIPTWASDFCVTGVKGTLTNAFIFKIEKRNTGDRMMTVMNHSRNMIFSSKVENHFTKFNTTGYGVCSLSSSGIDEVTGAHYKVEIKVDPHFEKGCNEIVVPTKAEYLSLKITPKGTTLGDDVTGYALSIIPCP